ARAPSSASPLAGWSGTAPAPAAPGSAPCCAYLVAATVCRARGPRGSGKLGSAVRSGRPGLLSQPASSSKGEASSCSTFTFS
uniref:Uncharacterized protein n=1 Tax=Nannospalax galili TaxID=1026970 RepID=A0A8C6RH64_NANGA